MEIISSGEAGVLSNRIRSNIPRDNCIMAGQEDKHLVAEQTTNYVKRVRGKWGYSLVFRLYCKLQCCVILKKRTKHKTINSK